MAISALNSNLGPGAVAAQFNSTRQAADPFAKTLGSAISSAAAKSTGSTCDPTSGPAIHVNDLRRAAELSLSEFKRTLKQVLADAGVDTSQLIRLEPDGNGGVTVAGQHPDRDKIEKIFEENPDLAAKFQAVAQRFVDLRAAENGPKSAHPLIAPTFGLLINDEDMQVAFQ